LSELPPVLHPAASGLPNTSAHCDLPYLPQGEDVLGSECLAVANVTANSIGCPRQGLYMLLQQVYGMFLPLVLDWFSPATSTIPIVMIAGSSDPIGEGLIASFARPGGKCVFLSGPAILREAV